MKLKQRIQRWLGVAPRPSSALNPLGHDSIESEIWEIRRGLERASELCNEMQKHIDEMQRTIRMLLEDAGYVYLPKRTTGGGWVKKDEVDAS
jgi:hypothetical protein